MKVDLIDNYISVGMVNLKQDKCTIILKKEVDFLVLEDGSSPDAILYSNGQIVNVFYIGKGILAGEKIKKEDEELYNSLLEQSRKIMKKEDMERKLKRHE